MAAAGPPVPPSVTSCCDLLRFPTELEVSLLLLDSAPGRGGDTELGETDVVRGAPLDDEDEERGEAVDVET